MEKRVQFRSVYLPWLLLAPQVLVIGVFFFWPAAQALLQSFQVQDAFGTSTEWVGLENFVNLWNDETYLDSFGTTAIFSALVASLGISISLVLAYFASNTQGVDPTLLNVLGGIPGQLDRSTLGHPTLRANGWPANHVR